jgi:hypothetical protein
MTTRTRRNLITFPQPFFLRTIDAIVPSGTYKLDTDEEIINGLYFVAYRRTATWLHLPSISTVTGVSQLIFVQPSELESGCESHDNHH